MSGAFVEYECAEQPVQEPLSTATDDQLIMMLVDGARVDGLQLTGKGRQPSFQLGRCEVAEGR